MANPDFSNKKLNHHFPINGRYPDNCDFMSLKETQTSSDDNITITNNYYRKNINTLSGDKVKIVKDSDNNYYVSYYGDENK